MLPRALRPGDLIGVPSPASPAPLDKLAAGQAELEDMGFRVRLGPLAGVMPSAGRFGADDDARAGELNAMLSDPAVRAIIPARGGYGMTRILDRIDYAALHRDPKPIVGFSDITALLAAVWRRTGVVAWHGRMAGQNSPWSDYDRQSLLRALKDPGPLGLVPTPPDGPPRLTIVPGRATGVLLGGNLSMLAALLGTPYELIPAGGLLLLEDVREPVYRIDRMLTSLRLAGTLAGVRGVVFAETVGVTDDAGRPSPDFVATVAGILAPLAIPCYYGLAAGHGRHHATLPLGVNAQLDADRCELRILDPALCR